MHTHRSKVLLQLPAKLRKRLKNLPLLQKMLGIVFTSILLISLLALLGLRLYSKAYSDLLYRSTAGNLNYSAYTISENLKTIESFSASIIASGEIQGALSDIARTDSSPVLSNASRKINNELQNYQTLLKANGSSFLVVENPRFSNSTYTLWGRKLSAARAADIAAEAGQRQGSPIWRPADPGSNALVMARAIRKIEGMDLSHLGTLLIYVDLNDIIRRTNAATTQYADSRYILSDGVHRLYAPSDMTEDELMHITAVKARKYQTLSLDGHPYFMVHNTIPRYGWEYYSLISYDRVIQAIRTTLVGILILLTAGIICTALMSRCLIHSVLRHIHLLIQKMDGFSKNKTTLLETEFEQAYEDAQDEIGELHRQFEAMAQRIQYLVNTNYVNALLSKEAQIHALEAQINPHFLYNTLESINWRAKAIGSREISLMTESLGSLLRATLSNRRSLVSISHELSLVQSYITIQQIRFEERLDYSVEVPQALSGALLPPLTLQPLIENAIHYALEEMTDTCYITIALEALDTDDRADSGSDGKPDRAVLPDSDGEPDRAVLPDSDGNAKNPGWNCESSAFALPTRLKISVRNSGSSFESGLLAQLREGARQPKRSGIGLLNIDRRVKLIFGDDYGLTLENIDNYAVASIIIPYRTEEDTTTC